MRAAGLHHFVAGAQGGGATEAPTDGHRAMGPRDARHLIPFPQQMLTSSSRQRGEGTDVAELKATSGRPRRRPAEERFSSPLM